MSSKNKREVYIVSCVRSPIGRGKKSGCFSGILPVHLLAQVLEEVCKRGNINKSLVEDIVCGCVSAINEQGGNIGRLGALQAGFPVTTSGVQLNRACGSAQQAVHFVSQAILSGDMEIGIGCGVEVMSQVPMGSTWGKKYSQNIQFRKNFPFNLIGQGKSADLIAKKYNISRKDCDDLAYLSHIRCGIARNNGYYKSQIVNIQIPSLYNKNKNKNNNVKIISNDEGIRYPPNRKKMDSLKPVFNKDGVVTAGNASQISDGASAILLASKEACIKYKLKPLAKMLSRVCVGSDPILMLDGIIPATRKALKKANLNINDIDLFEVNEAFACVPIAWRKTLGVNWNKVNISGGACGHGHPLGATGCILMTKLINDLIRTNKKYGLQTMCIGWGMATATIIERVNSNLFISNSKL